MDNVINIGTDAVLTTFPIKKRQSDGTLVALPGSEITSLKITIRNMDATRTVVNGKNNTVLTIGAGGVVWDASGNVTIPLSYQDNVLVNATLPKETHRVTLPFIYAGGRGIIEATYIVRNPELA